MSEPLAEAYPLQWPLGRPRAGYRPRSKFKTQLGAAIRLVGEEVRRLKATGLVVSTNLPTRRDGLPYADARNPEDPGAAVYFALNGRATCFACDKWDRVADNLLAIAKTIESLRGIERWGTGGMVAQAFAGFAAIPDRTGHALATLGLKAGATREQIEAAFRAKALVAHPDRGGSTEAMARLNEARHTLLNESSG